MNWRLESMRMLDVVDWHQLKRYSVVLATVLYNNYYYYGTYIIVTMVGFQEIA